MVGTPLAIVGLAAGTDPDDLSGGDTPVKGKRVPVGQETRTFLFFCPLPITYIIRLIYNLLTATSPRTALRPFRSLGLPLAYPSPVEKHP